MSCAPCRMSPSPPLDGAERGPPSCITPFPPPSRPSPVTSRSKNLAPFRHSSRKVVAYTRIFACEEDMPWRPVYEIIRAHTASLGGGIFLSGDRGAPSICCKRGAKTLGRERGRQSFAHATHGNYRRRGCWPPFVLLGWERVGLRFAFRLLDATKTSVSFLKPPLYWINSSQMTREYTFLDALEINVSLI